MLKFILPIAFVLCAGPVNWEVAEVYDGDTIALRAPNMPWTVIRLSGIDAPEHDQPYGDESRIALVSLLEGCNDVTFTAVDGDYYKRTVAHVKACGRDLGREMVKRGAAWVYPKYNRDPALPPLEEKAKAGKRGLWKNGTAVAPWQWRHKQR